MSGLNPSWKCTFQVFSTMRTKSPTSFHIYSNRLARCLKLITAIPLIENKSIFFAVEWHGKRYSYLGTKQTYSNTLCIAWLPTKLQGSVTLATSGDKVSDLLQYILYATKSSAFRLLISLPDAPKNQPEMNSSKLINEASERKRCLMRAILLGSSVSSTSAVAAAYLEAWNQLSNHKVA